MNPEPTNQTQQRKATAAKVAQFRRKAIKLDNDVALHPSVPSDVRALIRAIAEHPWVRGGEA